ncbi:PilZ domain-containing protein [Acetivibrio cellulolyticus]|uniref:PilZ domain-containing protein n=1 Tax=Acetivibrio cellulolyticus TaxID=35830 RepID=UPI0001E2D52F|nr:PilZ domain-containing protein [Acetivibrio cellulolyticus]
MGKDLLNTILKEGTLIYTKLSTSNVWHQNIVYKVENKSVSIALITGFLENIIMPGQAITLKLTNEEMEYLFIGTVGEIQPQFPSHIKVNIESIKDLKNSRVFPRYDVYLAANIKSESSGEENFAIIHDISLTGMAFYSKQHFEIGTEQLNLTIYLPNKNTIDAKGNINRKSKYDSYIDYGMHYTDMQEENNNSLYAFFSVLEEEKSRMKENFLNSIKKHLP